MDQSGRIQGAPLGSQLMAAFGGGLTHWNEKVNALGNATGATTINLTLGNVVTATTTGATTWTFSSPAPTGNLEGFVLILTNGGSQTQTWATGTKWPAGTAPTLTAAGIDILVFETPDAGTTWYGNKVGLAYA